jgi:hypothetical protein
MYSPDSAIQANCRVKEGRVLYIIKVISIVTKSDS